MVAHMAMVAHTFPFRMALGMMWRVVVHRLMRTILRMEEEVEEEEELVVVVRVLRVAWAVAWRHLCQRKSHGWHHSHVTITTAP